MILYNDDYPTIFNSMYKEKDKVDYYLKNKNIKSAIKDMMSKGVFPCWHYDILTVPDSGNRYLLYYYAMSPAETKKDCIFCGSGLIVPDKDGRNTVYQLKKMRMNNGDKDILSRFWAIQIYTSHFISRYRERYKYDEKIPSLEMTAIFLGRNSPFMVPLEYNKMVLEKNMQDNGSAWAIDDGVTLADMKSFFLEGKNHILVVRHKTFLSRDILKSNQSENTPSRREMHDRLTCHYYKK